MTDLFDNELWIVGNQKIAEYIGLSTYNTPKYVKIRKALVEEGLILKRHTKHPVKGNTIHPNSILKTNLNIWLILYAKKGGRL